MGWGVWDGQGNTPTGGSLVTYELTKRLSEYFDCTLIFETGNKRKVGRTLETGQGFTKRFIPRLRENTQFKEDFLLDYDLIHFWGRAPMFAYRFHTKVLLPHCHTLHSAVSMTEWIPIASAFYLPDHDGIALGSQCLAEVLTRFWKIPVEVIPYGVDTEFFKPMDKNYCRRHFNIPENSFVLGYLGRPAKLDFILAYDTLREIKKVTEKKNIVLLVSGGSLKVKPTYIADDFIYLGSINRSDVPVMLNSCDVFFNPIAGVQEGFGLTVVEAMACGLPIVTTSWNGYRETVTGDCGFLARTCWSDGDVWINQDDLISACVRLIKNESLREKCGHEARKIAEKKYLWEYCVAKYRDMYLNLIQKNTPKPCKKAPVNVSIRIGDSNLTFSLEEVLKVLREFRIDFEQIYKGFVSNEELDGNRWRKFICKDNILNLPKYRWHMKKTLINEEERLKVHFPKLWNTLNL